jgi:NADP-dependent 3-hydroxy acid dehydrogenase YdfG
MQEVYSMSELTGRRILVTGASRGIGASIAVALAEKGADVAITYQHSTDRAAEVVRAIEAQGRHGLAIQADAADPLAVRRSVEEAATRLGGLDTLVNNAAGNFLSASEDLSPNAFNTVVQIVLNGTFHCTSAFGKRRIAAKQKGNILNIVTTYAWMCSAFVLPSACAKAGVLAMTRSLAVEWATERIQFDQRIYDFQGVSFPLADSAADAAAARLLTREAAVLMDEGVSPKVVHAKASLAKLFASEAAWRCADRVVQVFGGRGYMREYPAERYLRELRVDRIWEGTSEIQRLIIARSLEKRGVDAVVG